MFTFNLFQNMNEDTFEKYECSQCNKKTKVKRLIVGGSGMIFKGSGFYLTANLGPGSRDGLMTGLQKMTNKPIFFIRTIIEISVVIVGWYLGGVVGIGTILFALGIGPFVSFGLFSVSRIIK